jgi:hypothetical protein
MAAMAHAVIAMPLKDIIGLCEGHYLRIIEIAGDPSL